jgi:hypothetical protein
MCVSSQLDLFEGPCKQISQEKNSFVGHFPLTALSDGPIEFEIPASSMYIDLSQTRLYLRMRIVSSSGASLAEDVVVMPVNMLHHALFRKVDVFLNGRQITQSNDLYPWKAGIETMLNFGKGSKDTQLESIFTTRIM